MLVATNRIGQNRRRVFGAEAVSIFEKRIMEGGRIVLDGTSDKLRSNEDVKEFYLGGGSTRERSYKAVKSYRRRKRWLS